MLMVDMSRGSSMLATLVRASGGRGPETQTPPEASPQPQGGICDI